MEPRAFRVRHAMQVVFFETRDGNFAEGSRKVRERRSAIFKPMDQVKPCNCKGLPE